MMVLCCYDNEGYGQMEYTTPRGSECHPSFWRVLGDGHRPNPCHRHQDWRISMRYWELEGTMPSRRVVDPLLLESRREWILGPRFVLSKVARNWNWKRPRMMMMPGGWWYRATPKCWCRPKVLPITIYRAINDLAKDDGLDWWPISILTSRVYW